MSYIPGYLHHLKSPRIWAVTIILSVSIYDPRSQPTPTHQTFDSWSKSIISKILQILSYLPPPSHLNNGSICFAFSLVKQGRIRTAHLA